MSRKMTGGFRPEADGRGTMARYIFTIRLSGSLPNWLMILDSSSCTLACQHQIALDQSVRRSGVDEDCSSPGQLKRYCEDGSTVGCG